MRVIGTACSMASPLPGRGLLFIATTWLLVTLARCEPAFNGLTSIYSGSVAGGTEIALLGQEFSQVFELNDDSRGNKVYLTNGYTQIPCDVVPYRSNPSRLVCVTRPGEEGLFEVIVEVDGTQIPECTGRSRICRFEYRNRNNHEKLTQIFSYAGPVGSSTTTLGKYYTNVYENAANSLSDVTNSLYIVQITWGPYKCNPIDATTGEPIRLEYQYEDNVAWVYVACSPETNVPGSYPLVVQISGDHGNAYAPSSTYMVDGQGKRYHYQQYAVITSISPQSGSLEGGTLVTVQGDGFLLVNDVLVGGEPCDIVTQEPKKITCSTSPAPESSDLYPGSRGLLLEWWTDQTSNQGLDDFHWNTSDSVYVRGGIIDAAFTDEEPNDNQYASRLSGYFAPPQTGDYTFYVRGDDVVDLWLSNSSNPENAVKIAYSETNTNSFNVKDGQQSHKLTLEQDKLYYLEARHYDYAHGSDIELGVALHQTTWTEKDVARANNDVQLIEIVADSNPEVQIIRVAGQKEVQLISIDISSCETEDQEDCILTVFTVTYDGVSADFTNLSTSQELEDALNSLSTLETNQVVVTLDEDDTFLNFTVYFTQEESVSEMIVLTYTGNETVSITVDEVSEGTAGVAPDEFTITYAGIQSTPLSFSSSAQEVEDALVDMTGFRCSPELDPDFYHFFQDYESDKENTKEYGERVRDQEAYCGRTSLKNPQYIFRESWTPSSDEDTKGRFDISSNKELCFGIRGSGFRGRFQVQYAVQSRDPSDVSVSYINDWIAFFNDEEVPSNIWERRCFNLYDIANDDDEYDLNNFVYKAYRIQIDYDSAYDFYVDYVSIGRKTSGRCDVALCLTPVTPSN